jgi:integrase
MFTSVTGRASTEVVDSFGGMKGMPNTSKRQSERLTILAVGTLTFDAAVKAAREAVVAARSRAVAEAAGPIMTVRAAVEKYVCGRDARATVRAGKAVRSDAASRLGLHVLANAKLSDVELRSLTEEDLARWRAQLGGKISTRKRLVNDLRAALNAAAVAGRKVLPPDLPAIIKNGLARSEAGATASSEPVARENQILTDEQVRGNIRAAASVDAEDAWDGDLHRMVLLLASTGARFSQLARLRVGDVQAARVLVPTSRIGRTRDDSNTPVPIGSDVIKALLPILRDRKAGDYLLERWFHVQHGPEKWQRDRRAPWGAAFEITKLFRRIAIAAGVPGMTTYALRHSSIVRGLRAGLPIRLVASLHDTSTPIIERYYSRHIADGLDELAVRAIVPLV